MSIILANRNDMADIWSLKEKTSKLLKDRQIDQWQYNNPSHQQFLDDIDRQELYLYKENNQIVGMIAIKEGGDETYDIIYDGAWGFDEPYLTIHRLAVDTNHLGKGIAEKLLVFSEKLAIEKKTPYIRMDTHRDNRYAKRLFESFGYQLRGWILLNPQEGDRERLAYDKKMKG
ncbi:MAG: GNAT family N-acetyltransferase [Acholeplasmataceae bacterium]|nr:GNAT family N-acetyltransferase [Acholeplasmataceae bacterium]